VYHRANLHVFAVALSLGAKTGLVLDEFIRQIEALNADGGFGLAWNAGKRVLHCLIAAGCIATDAPERNKIKLINFGKTTALWGRFQDVGVEMTEANYQHIVSSGFRMSDLMDMLDEHQQHIFQLVSCERMINTVKSEFVRLVEDFRAGRSVVSAETIRVRIRAAGPNGEISWRMFDAATAVVASPALLALTNDDVWAQVVSSIVPSIWISPTLSIFDVTLPWLHAHNEGYIKAALGLAGEYLKWCYKAAETAAVTEISNILSAVRSIRVSWLQVALREHFSFATTSLVGEELATLARMLPVLAVVINDIPARTRPIVVCPVDINKAKLPELKQFLRTRDPAVSLQREDDEALPHDLRKQFYGKANSNDTLVVAAKDKTGPILTRHAKHLVHRHKLDPQISLPLGNPKNAARLLIHANRLWAISHQKKTTPITLQFMDQVASDFARAVHDIDMEMNPNAPARDRKLVSRIVFSGVLQFSYYQRLWGSCRLKDEGSCENFFKEFKNRLRKSPSISPGALGKSISVAQNLQRQGLLRKSKSQRQRAEYENHSIENDMRTQAFLNHDLLEYPRTSASTSSSSTSSSSTSSSSTSSSSTSSSSTSSSSTLSKSSKSSASASPSTSLPAMLTTVGDEQSNIRVHIYKSLKEFKNVLQSTLPAISLWCRGPLMYAEILDKKIPKGQRYLVQLKVDDSVQSLNVLGKHWFALTVVDMSLSRVEMAGKGLFPAVAMHNTTAPHMYYIFRIDAKGMAGGDQWRI
jgi:hypothetical protein